MSNDLPIYLLTNTKHHWLIPGFVWLFQTYWGDRQPVHVFSYGRRDYFLTDRFPDIFTYTSLGRRNLPAGGWSTGLLNMIEQIESDFFILFLEDYWLNAPVRVDIVERLFDYVLRLDENDRLLRLDLTADRSSKGYTQWTRREGVRVILSNRNAPYQMSFQAGIWNKENLRQVLLPGESPWESEVNGTKRLQTYGHLKSMFVLGTLEHPVKYRPVYRTHKKQLDLSHIPQQPKEILSRSKRVVVPTGVKIKWV